MALAKKGGRVEILLVLPYVLIGLGLVTVVITRDQIHTDLWPLWWGAVAAVVLSVAAATALGWSIRRGSKVEHA